MIRLNNNKQSNMFIIYLQKLWCKYIRRINGNVCAVVIIAVPFLKISLKTLYNKTSIENK